MVHLQPFHLRRDVVGVVQQDRDGDQRAPLRRDTFCQIKTGQRFGRQGPGDHGVDYGNPKVGRDAKSENPEDDQCEGSGTCCEHQRQGKSDDCQRYKRNRVQISCQADVPDLAQPRQPGGRAEADLRFKIRAPFTDEPVTGIAAVIGSALLGQRQAGIAYRTFGQIRSACQNFNLGPVPVPGGKIHRGVCHVVAQARVNQADLFKKVSPVDL